MRAFDQCPRNTRKWKQTIDRRNSLERIDTRVGHELLRGQSAMHRRIAGNRLGLPGKEQTRQDAQPGDTAGRLKQACCPGLDHAAVTDPGKSAILPSISFQRETLEILIHIESHQSTSYNLVLPRVGTRK